MTSPSPAPSSSRSELLFLGRECHHPSCHLNEFLPFECPACHLSFCQPHFLPSQHTCTAPLPPSMIDRIAPTCPMCNQTVPTSSTRDPNESVEKHILGGTCVAMEGGEERRKAEIRRKKERGQICWKKGCAKSIVVPMKCEACTHVFCPTHRHSTSHTCTPITTPSTNAQIPPSRPGTKAAMSRLLAPASSSRPLNTTTTSSAKPPSIANPPPTPLSAPQPITAAIDARAAAAAAAMKRAGQDVKVPFVKTKQEKRTNAEIESKIQAMKTRHDKGLLSKTEEVKYAEMVGKRESQRRKGGKGDGEKDGCLIS